MRKATSAALQKVCLSGRKTRGGNRESRIEGIIRKEMMRGGRGNERKKGRKKEGRKNENVKKIV